MYFYDEVTAGKKATLVKGRYNRRADLSARGYDEVRRIRNESERPSSGRQDCVGLVRRAAPRIFSSV